MTAGTSHVRVTVLALLLIQASALAQPAAGPDAGRRDAWGDPLPPGALFRTGTLRAQHEVSGPLHYSPDGKLLAAPGHDGTIRLWDAATGQEVRRLAGHEGSFLPVRCLAFFPDGKTLASGGQDKLICLWDVATGKEVKRFTGHETSLSDVVVSPDGRRLIATDGWAIRFWDVAAGKELRCIPTPGNPVWSLSLSPDGKHMAGACHQGPIKLWDTTTGKELDPFKGSKTERERPVILPDGKTLLTAAYDGPNPVLWELDTGKEVRRFPGLGEFSRFHRTGKFWRRARSVGRSTAGATARTTRSTSGS